MQSGSEGRIALDTTFGDAYMYVGAWVPRLSGKTGILSEEGCLPGLARRDVQGDSHPSHSLD